MFNLLQLHKLGNSLENPQAADPDERQHHQQTESESSGSESESGVENKLKAGRNKRKPVKKKGKGGKKWKKTHKPKVLENKMKPASDAGWFDRFQITETIDEGNEDLGYHMLIYCFFEDFNAILTYICKRWCDYFYDKFVSLITPAIITNAAELFREMEKDLLRLLRKNGLQEL
ncbi:hypothetical protein LZ31DRAFT_542498 [Colletotrichum somersetense]|nr:hypothetical protein LZ31DRAFT_542498 [Colletotrichum somersetense]